MSFGQEEENSIRKHGIRKIKIFTENDMSPTNIRYSAGPWRVCVAIPGAGILFTKYLNLSGFMLPETHSEEQR
jgi:hypothetical protein